MRKLILLLFFSQYTALHDSAEFGRLEVTRLLVESKADVAARSRCFSPPPSHHLSLTICLAALASLHSTKPSATLPAPATTQPALLHTCAASARPNDAPPRLLRASAPRNTFYYCSCHRRWFAATAVGGIRIGSGDCNMHAIQHECAMRCIQPHVVHVNPCTLPLPLPMNPIACNMKRADGCKHHLYPARNNKNVLSFLSFTRQNQQNQCIASQPQRVGGGSAIRVLNFSR